MPHASALRALGPACGCPNLLLQFVKPAWVLTQSLSQIRKRPLLGAFAYLAERVTA